MGLHSPSSLLAFLGPEWRSSLHSYIVIYHSPCFRGIFDSAHRAACHWFRPYPPHRVDSISLIFVFWWLLFCPIWSSELKLKSGCIRWLVRVSLQEHENSVVSAFRSLNKINEFPGRVRGSQKQSQLCLSICHPHEPMVLIFLSLVWVFSKTQLQQLSSCGQFETMGLLWKPLFRPSVSDVFPEKTSSDSAGAGQTTALGNSESQDARRVQVLQRTHSWLHERKSTQQKDPGPCLGASKCPVTFLHISQGTLPLPALSLGLSQSSKKTGFSSENYLDDPMKYLGSGSSAWSNSIVIWSSRR